MSLERARLNAAAQQFRDAVRKEQSDLAHDPIATAEMTDVVEMLPVLLRDSETIFDRYEEGNIADAAGAMSRLDRTYARMRKEIEDVRRRVRERQVGDFRAELRRDRRLEVASWITLGLMGFLVAALIAYGRHLDREVLTSGEREQYIDTLRKREEELHEAIAERDARGKESIQKQKLLAEAQRIAQMGAWEWEIASGRVWWSDEYYHLFRLPVGDFVPSYAAFMDKVVPADRERVAQRIAQSVADRAPFEHEYGVLLPDGETRVHHTAARVEVDADGNPVRMFGVSQDVTERKWAEEQLLRQEAQLAEAQRIARMGSWEMDLKTGEVIWSDELYEILGYASGEVKPSLNAYMSLIPPDEGKRVSALLEKAMAGEEHLEIEHSLLRTDGVTVCLLVQAVITRDSDHKPVRVLGVSQDITARKQAEDALRSSEQRFQLASRATSDVIWDWNVTTNSIWVSEGFASHLGYPEWGDIDLRVWDEGIHPDDRERFRASIHEAIDGVANDWTGQYRFRKFGGDWREVLDRGYIMRDASGKAVRMIGAMTDITERRAMEQMKDEFISTVSHELRTPLTSIRGALGLLSSGRLGKFEEKAQRLLEIASTNTDRLVRLINDILDIERIESGKVTLVKTNCDAAHLARQAADVVRALADRENIAITVDAEPLALVADPDRMIQTLTNLLGNAVKFSPAGSTIHVATKREGQNVVFSVADQGRGIPAGKLATIFERFQQVDASDSRDKGGSGLGLAICRSIVRQHGGDIHVESEVGRGSTFIVTIPSGAAAPAEPVERPGPEKLVYVCDDDEAARDALHYFLAERGYHIREMASGQELLHAVAEKKPDAILLDLFMPDMNGWETLARLKSDPETSNVPVIVVSMLSPDDTGATGLDLSGWVQKPLDERALAGVVDRALGKQRKPRLMLVEDDADLAAIIIASFERYGIETTHARSGKEAIEMARRVQPDLLILDLVLPDLDGYAVVDWLKDHEVWRGLPLVVYSATEPSPSQRDRLRLGHTEFMIKSRVAPEEFERRIVTLLDSLIDGSGGSITHVP